MTNAFMTDSFAFTRRRASLRVPLFAAVILLLGGCDASETLTPDTAALPETGVEVVDVPAIDADDAVDPDAASLLNPSFSTVQFAGGIPFGTFHQPSASFGTSYNGGLRNIYPAYLLNHLKEIKARGGKVILNLGGSQSRYQDSKNNFSLSMWKASVDRFRNTNFDSYIKDGTIIGHYLMDEPHNTSRWNGKVVPPATLDEMAKYSKSRWPGMATVVRAYPKWLAKYSGSYRYLDAAWVQYAARFGDAGSFMRQEIGYAQKKGLAIIAGLNVLRGGPNGKTMTASQLQSYGSALLASSYPCAFISWQYSSSYLNGSTVKSAMKSLQSKAQSRSSKSCRG
jgi:hypothetical protein